MNDYAVFSRVVFQAGTASNQAETGALQKPAVKMTVLGHKWSDVRIMGGYLW
jgi:hypothetical protein